MQMLADLRARRFTNHLLHDGTLICKLWVTDEQPQRVCNEVQRLGLIGPEITDAQYPMARQDAHRCDLPASPLDRSAPSFDDLRCRRRYVLESCQEGVLVTAQLQWGEVDLWTEAFEKRRY